MTFQTIFTTYGLNRIASAVASGTTINLVAMAVGDGNGNPTTPSVSQTALAREMYRHAVNRVYQDPTDSTLFTAELIVPASVSGFTMREVAVFDSSGGLFAVGNLPETYKPSSSEGAFSDAVIRLQFKVSNASIITLQIDPNVALATHSWVINNLTTAFLIPGGTTHQVLRKHSNADGDTEWADPTDVNVVVDTIEEVQTLAAGQTTVTLSTTTTDGLAIYIEGVRLRKSQWTTVDSTHLTLAASYAAGTKLIAVQNEPPGSLVYPLARDLNLSDVPDKATARANLGVYSKAESDASGQPSAVAYFARSTAPAGWLKANGAAVSRTAYAALFAAIGTTFGAGDGSTTFNLPDLRGEFIRGWDDGRGIDPGRALGSNQRGSLLTGEDAANSVNTLSVNNGSNRSMAGWDAADASTYTGLTLLTAAASGIYNASDPTIMSTHMGVARPRSVALLPCIHY